MKNLIRVNKGIHVLVILAFFLPFITFKCGPSASEMEAQRIADSIKLADSLTAVQLKSQLADSAKTTLSNKDFIDTIQSNDTILTIDTLSSKLNNNSNKHLDDNWDITDSIVAKNRLLKILLRPNDDYTGIGFMISRIEFFIPFGTIYFAFLLLLIALIFRFIIKSLYYNSFVNLILNSIGFISLLISAADLWGYKTCIAIWMILLIIDSVILFKNRIK